MVLLGRDQPDGFVGTGFVISRKHCLVLTAGHVADGAFEEGSIFAVLHGSSKLRRIKQVWYHPRVRRQLDFGLEANSFDSKDGGIQYPSPDLAVLQLEPDGGELPSECDLKIQEVPRILDGQPVGILGFWQEWEVPPNFGVESFGVLGFSLERGDIWPSADRPAVARYCTSTLRPAFAEPERTRPEFQDHLFCDIGEISGGSGGPVFLSDGRVVGILTGTADYSKTIGKPDELRVLRIETLRELLTYYQLWNLMPMPPQPVKVRSDWGPDPRLSELRAAVALARKARELRNAGQYDHAVECCDRALLKAPDYAGAFAERSKSYLFFMGKQWEALTADARQQYAQSALADADRCNEIDPGWNYGQMIYMQSILFDSCASGDHSGFRFVVDTTSKNLRPGSFRNPLSEFERSFLFNLRGQAYQFLGQADLAERDYGESIRVAPGEPQWYLNRANFLRHLGRPDAARLDELKADELRQTGGPVSKSAQ